MLEFPNQDILQSFRIVFTAKPVLSGQSKIDKIKALKTDYRLMQVEVLQKAPLGAFCKSFDLH